MSRGAATTGAFRSGRRKQGLTPRRRARRLILQALYQWLLSPAQADRISAQFKAGDVGDDEVGKVDWEFFDEVFPAITTAAASLDARLLPCLDRQLKALDPVEKALLYLGAFELQQRPDVPRKVVINECIELAKTFGATDSYKYVNGVLDKLSQTLRPV